MELENNTKKSQKIEKKSSPNKKLDSYENPLIITYLSTKEKQNEKNIQKIPLELDKQKFEIIQQKNNIVQKMNDLSLNENKIEKSSEINYIKNESKIENENKIENINDKKSNIINKKIIEKNNIATDNDITYKYNNNKNNNKTIYTLLNSYYKDVDLNINVKKENSNNIGKNFLHKNEFQEASKKYSTNNFQNNLAYSFYYTPNYINEIQNNPNAFSYNYNNQYQPYSFPENAFKYKYDNNSTNYFFNNNINNYSFNFHTKYNKKPKENIDPKFFWINLEKILKGIDKRTTIMIRHIPNKYSYQNILEEINIVCKDKYDFFYLPLDFENNCNLGYAFINFTNPLHIIYFYNNFKSRKWLHYNSYKECDLTFAKYQGKYELTSNIEKNLGKNDDKRRKPIIFEINNPPKIDLFKKYYEIIKEYRPELLDEINWI